MTIDTGIQGNVLVPFMWVRVAPTQTPFSASARMFLFGFKTSGNGHYDTPYLLSPSLVESLFGRASSIAAMYRQAYALNPLGEIWGAAGTPGSGTAQQRSVQVSSAPTVAGICSFRIGTLVISTTIRTTDTQSAVAIKLRNVINGNGYCPFSAAISTSDSTLIILTARAIGSWGQRIKWGTAWWGHTSDLAGSLLTFAGNLTPGTGSYDITASLAALNDMQTDVIVSYSVGSAAAISDFLQDTDGRWSEYQQLYGHGIMCDQDTLSDLVTLGNSYNDQHLTIIGSPTCFSTEWEIAGAVGAQVQIHLGNGPPECSRPLQTLALPGIEAPYLDDSWFDISERQSLYAAGVGALRVDEFRNVLIDRLVTTYKTNVDDDPDASFRDIETMYQLMFFVRSMRTAITGAYARAALTDEDTGIDGFVSVGQIKDLLVQTYSGLEKLGLVENTTLFAAGLQVERDTVDATRVNALLPVDVVNQLRIFAALVQSYLQFPPTGFQPATD